MLDTDKLKALRLKRGLTQEEAAQKAGFNGKQRWNNIENGREANITMETLGKIAEALECKPKDLLK